MSAPIPNLTLILGGVRAGKSALAERLAAADGPRVLYVATAEPLDDEMRIRIEAHRAGRPTTWTTLEAPLDPAGALSTAPEADAVLLDCLTVWTSNVLLRHLDADAFTRKEHARAEAEMMTRLDALLDWQQSSRVPLYIVSNEVGLGVVPPSPLGRAYADTLGRLNQRVAARAGRTLLVVAGLALDLRALGAVSIDAAAGRSVE